MHQAQTAIFFKVEARFAGGFTLLEMLVVLLLGSLLVGTVLPAMQRMHEAAQYKTTRDAIVGRLGELGYEAFASGRSLLLTSQTAETSNTDTTALVSPNINATTSRATERTSSSRFPAEAAEITQAVPEALVLSLPPGWAIEAQPPIRFAFTGICEGGTVVLYPPGRAPERLRLIAPLCKVASDGN